MASPYINHFLQPDSIIPDLSNPQSWNRYSYATNRPINFNDPSGHKVEKGDGAGSYCDANCQLYKKLKRMEEKTKDNGGKKKTPAPVQNHNEGTIYTSISVIPDSVFHNAQLSTKAEESYGGWSGSGSLPYNFTAGLDNYVDATSIPSDFYNPPPGSDPISLRINWRGNAHGITIESVNLHNYSPTAVYIDAIRFRNFTVDMSPIIMNGSREDYAGKNGDLTLNVNTTVSIPQFIDVQLISVGGYKDKPYVSIFIPLLPPNGCSIVHFK